VSVTDTGSSARLSIRSSGGNYEVVSSPDFATAIAQTYQPGTFALVDARVLELYRPVVTAAIPDTHLLPIVAREETKSFEALTPVFTPLLERGIKRDGSLLVIGGGVLQDIGCFVASVLFRGIPWRFVPTTLLAQADSCIGSKSSINIGTYKNQIGTFYPPRDVALTADVLDTLTWDDVRSGVGEMLKLHLLAGEAEYRALLTGLRSLPADRSGLAQQAMASLRIKQGYIEVDEFDTGVRNLLNYGHTFGHAYESATHYAIPHGIGVTLGMLTATFVSARLGMVSAEYFAQLERELRPWYQPFHSALDGVEMGAIERAIRTDKKATATGVNCILTRGAGTMEKIPVPLQDVLMPAITDFLAHCREHEAA
jgi:3-dehydroquinate synthase